MSMGEPNPAGSQRRTALLLVDVINDMEFEGSESLVRCAEPMATRLHELKQRCRDAGIPTVYINDNFGKWRSDFRSLVDHCINDPVPGREVARLLKPDNDDYFVLKPKNSAFFGTTLDTLLISLNTDTVILTGIAGDNCVLFSANDAYLRDYKLFIPADCIASNSKEENDAALRLMEKVVKADVRPSTELDLSELP
ncbi:MAG TPA: isochorismatase family cysteine hydrolase [Vicinamibacterales bacterium]|jgi:nicotinamidase-related amidase